MRAPWKVCVWGRYMNAAFRPVGEDGWTVVRTAERRNDGTTERRTDGTTERRNDERMHGRMYGHVHGCTYARKHAQQVTRFDSC